MLHPPYLACLAVRNGGTSFSTYQALVGSSGVRKSPIAHCTRASPSVRSALASLSWYGPCQSTTSPPWTGTGWRPVAERVTNVGWWVQTGGLASPGAWGGL